MNSNTLNVYVAAPLFSEAEREFNRQIKSRIKDSARVFLPQEDGGLLAEMLERGVDCVQAKKSIFQGDLRAIRSATIVLIVMDGRTIDEGAAFELGYAHALGKICIGLQTDTRRLLPSGNNPMISEALVDVMKTIDELTLWIEKYARESVDD